MGFVQYTDRITRKTARPDLMMKEWGGYISVWWMWTWKGYEGKQTDAKLQLSLCLTMNH